MSRIVIENIFFFLLPTLVYVAWVAYSENEWPGLGSVLSRAPLLKLFLAGGALMLTTLVLLSTRSGNDPHSVYVPPGIENGQLQPGHRAPPPGP